MDRILEYIHQNPLVLVTVEQEKQYGKTVRVDIDEYVKAENGEVLETWGVSTCTGFIATIPERFGYLAHISPKDKMYNGNETNLVEQLTKKIKGFDVYPCERQDVLFMVIAFHLDRISNIVDQLIEEGFFLHPSDHQHKTRHFFRDRTHQSRPHSSAPTRDESGNQWISCHGRERRRAFVR